MPKHKRPKLNNIQKIKDRLKGFNGLPVFNITIDNDCLECGVQSIELVSDPIHEFIVLEDGKA